MPEKKSNSAAGVERLQDAIDALVAQLADLNARLEKLEAGATATPVAAPAPVVAKPAVAEPVPAPPAPAVAAPAEPAKAEPAPAKPEKVEDELSDELVLILSAAVAAYLGKRPHIRAIRPLGSSAWAQQGRVFVQASHQLNIPHDA